MIGCACIATGTLAAILRRSGPLPTAYRPNVTCINMMLTQRFTPEDPRREGAILWNYAGMNVGFFVGFSVAGYFQATESYSRLFIFATLGNFVAIILAALTWKTLADRNTTLLDERRSSSAAPARRHRHSYRPTVPSCGSCSSGPVEPRR